MGAFNQKKTFNFFPDTLEDVIADVENHFQAKGYKTTNQKLISGGYDLSITNKNIFKSISGMQTALKIKLQPGNQIVTADVSVGIWGQQLLPTVVSMLFFWPVLITQIWGIVKQSKLDNKALQLIEASLQRNCRVKSAAANEMIYCPTCGSSYPLETKFCSEDGTKLN